MPQILCRGSPASQPQENDFVGFLEGAAESWQKLAVVCRKWTRGASPRRAGASCLSGRPSLRGRDAARIGGAHDRIDRLLASEDQHERLHVERMQGLALELQL